ncbi:type II secretion system protein [Rhizobium leguminosarum]|uniref:type II secretion system protein n=1 Tax=Rhizobium leguminosarum TaxID=384 RepID=UPI000FEC7183|nr:hypothetical protein [Rhizobium leguminosarum]RWX24511.1 hypothetical protein EHI43_31955 [Rhizobium leguminosarum]
MSKVPTPQRKSSPFIRAIKSDGFIEKLVLLVLTAILSGIFVPLIIKSIDQSREARQAVATAQAKLFDDISDTILTLETLMLDVSWFGQGDAKNADMQTRAFDRYTERSVDLIVKWRVDASRAQALASPETAEKMQAFLDRFFREQDTPTNRSWNECHDRCDWEAQHKKNAKMLTEANRLILEIGSEFQLTAKSSESR